MFCINKGVYGAKPENRVLRLTGRSTMGGKRDWKSGWDERMESKNKYKVQTDWSRKEPSKCM